MQEWFKHLEVLKYDKEPEYRVAVSVYLSLPTYKRHDDDDDDDYNLERYRPTRERRRDCSTTD